MSCKVSFIGLGVMGYPMAGYISKAGHNVTVFNRTKSKAEKWIKEFNGKIAATPDEAAKTADFVFTCVGNDNDLKEVAIGNKGIFNTIKKGSIYIDNTTASATVARELYAKAKTHGFGFLDAPVSGGQTGAENGALTVMVGGNKNDFDKVEPALRSYGKTIELIGNSGSGQLSKMINQICIAGLVQGLSEALAFGKKSNIDMEKVIKVISKGAAQSWQMENRYKTMLDGKFDFGFAVDWMRKDLSICFKEAKKNGSHLPITKIIDVYYEEIQKRGDNRFDTSSLISLLK